MPPLNELYKSIIRNLQSNLARSYIFGLADHAQPLGMEAGARKAIAEQISSPYIQSLETLQPRFAESLGGMKLQPNYRMAVSENIKKARPDQVDSSIASYDTRNGVIQIDPMVLRGGGASPYVKGIPIDPRVDLAGSHYADMSPEHVTFHEAYHHAQNLDGSYFSPLKSAISLENGANNFSRLAQARKAGLTKEELLASNQGVNQALLRSRLDLLKGAILAPSLLNGEDPNAPLRPQMREVR